MMMNPSAMGLSVRRAGSGWRRGVMLGAFLLAGLAWAASALGTNIPATAPVRPASPAPAEVALALPAARLHGHGTLRFFGLTIYDARLWAAADFAAQRFDDHAFALELEYARKLEGSAIAQRSIVEMRRAETLSDAQAQAWQAALQRAFPDIAPGDRLTGVHVPGAATRFFHNGKPTAQVPGADFARLFFGIWLAPTTSEPQLRTRLIGSVP